MRKFINTLSQFIRLLFAGENRRSGYSKTDDQLSEAYHVKKDDNFTNLPYEMNDSIHEAGHILVAKLFEEAFIIRSVTLNPALYSSNVNIEQWRGGTHISPRQKPLQFCDQEKLVAILYAGLCSQNIYAIGIDRFDRKSIMQYSFWWPRDFNIEGCGGDFEISDSYITHVSMAKKLRIDEYKMAIIHFNLSYLSNEVIWQAVLELSNRIRSSQSRFLNQSEVEQCIAECGVNEFLRKNKETLIDGKFC